MLALAVGGLGAAATATPTTAATAAAQLAARARFALDLSTASIDPWRRTVDRHLDPCAIWHVPSRLGVRYGFATKIRLRQVAGQLAGVVQAGLSPDAHWLTLQTFELALGSGVAEA